MHTQAKLPPLGRDIAHLIDHTLLRADATLKLIEQLCDEANRYCFATVCVNPTYVRAAAARLAGGVGVGICTGIGFPLGATPPEVKAYEAARAVDDGATELDMVQNIGALKSGDVTLLRRDMAAVIRVAVEKGVICKVILEMAALTPAEKELACAIARDEGAHFVKTSTGFGAGGATVEDVALMRRVVGPEMGVKAAGGIRTLTDVYALVMAGATRIGTSAGVEIVSEALGEALPEGLQGSY